MVKNPPAMGDLGSISGLGRSAGEGKGYHSSVLAWRTPWAGYVVFKAHTTDLYQKTVYIKAIKQKRTE